MATISSLRKALDSGGGSFRTLYDMVWDGSPIVRSKYFSECRVSIAGEPTLLMMPLTSTALQHVEALLPHKPHLRSDIVPQIKILRDEICYISSTNTVQTADILLEPLVEGTPLKMAISEAESDPALADILATAIDRLEKQLILAEISHNNLKEENLLLDQHNNLRPIHWYYATKGAGGDADTIATLRTKIAALRNNNLLCEPDAPNYSFEICDLSQYRNTLGYAEGLIGVETEDGWGFIDCNGKEIIRPQYRWVSRFAESRAEVETDNGMGLIDKSGRYIISPNYCIVDYNPVTGHSMVNNGSEWAEFDYSGNIITPFGEAEPEI